MLSLVEILRLLQKICINPINTIVQIRIISFNLNIIRHNILVGCEDTMFSTTGPRKTRPQEEKNRAAFYWGFGFLYLLNAHNYIIQSVIAM